MTLRMYADRKGLPLDRVRVEVSHDKTHAADADTAGSSSAGARIDRFTRVLHLDGDLDADQLDALVRIADRCPVHRTLERSSQIVTQLADADAPDGPRSPR
jgi:putative redox protein